MKLFTEVISAQDETAAFVCVVLRETSAAATRSGTHWEVQRVHKSAHLNARGSSSWIPTVHRLHVERKKKHTSYRERASEA